MFAAAEIHRLGAVLTRHEADRPQVVAIIRLLLFTGCRKSEVVALKRSYCREGKLFLRTARPGRAPSDSRLLRARSSTACSANQPGCFPSPLSKMCSETVIT